MKLANIVSHSLSRIEVFGATHHAPCRVLPHSGTPYLQLRLSGGHFRHYFVYFITEQVDAGQMPSLLWGPWWARRVATIDHVVASLDLITARTLGDLLALIEKDMRR